MGDVDEVDQDASMTCTWKGFPSIICPIGFDENSTAIISMEVMQMTACIFPATHAVQAEKLHSLPDVGRACLRTLTTRNRYPRHDSVEEAQDLWTWHAGRRQFTQKASELHQPHAMKTGVSRCISWMTHPHRLLLGCSL